MEYNKAVRSMRTGDAIEGFYILKGAYPKVASNGKPFLNVPMAKTAETALYETWSASFALDDPDLIARAKAEKERRTGGQPYICPIPAGVAPQMQG